MTPQETQRHFVFLSGLPGSGKTTLAHRLAKVLDLPVIDKDDILERLFDSKGAGGIEQRRALSRESDVILKNEAMASTGAIIVSFWHAPGMPDDTGTPTDWLATLSDHVVNVHCTCRPEIAADRFLNRKRHSAHLDTDRSPTEVLASLRNLSSLPPLPIRQRIDVDTSNEPDLGDVVGEIQRLCGTFARRWGGLPPRRPGR